MSKAGQMAAEIATLYVERHYRGDVTLRDQAWRTLCDLVTVPEATRAVSEAVEAARQRDAADDRDTYFSAC